MDNRPIGIFDSGIGGLTVLEELKRQLPNESVIYYGDLARVPFGNKTKEEIIAINQDIISYLLTRNVKLVIAACNTSSAVALEYDKDMFDLPIVGLIGPAANTAFALTKNKRIGVIATEATVKSKAYRLILNSINPSLNVFEQACPKFVPLIEAGKTSGPELEEAIAEYIQPLLDKQIDTLVLGCSHYPLIAAELRKFIGPNVKFVDPAVGTVALVKEILQEENRLGTGPASYEYVASIIQGGKYVRVDGRELLLRRASVAQK